MRLAAVWLDADIAVARADQAEPVGRRLADMFVQAFHGRGRGIGDRAGGDRRGLQVAAGLVAPARWRAGGQRQTEPERAHQSRTSAPPSIRR